MTLADTAALGHPQVVTGAGSLALREIARRVVCDLRGVHTGVHTGVHSLLAAGLPASIDIDASSPVNMMSIMRKNFYMMIIM